MDKSIQNLLFQTRVLDSCLHKFQYEADSYLRGQSYEPLNLDDANNRLLYDELNAILDNHQIPYTFRDITARIKKIFCSCCDYHCIELLDTIKGRCERESPIVRAPILYIVYVLRKYIAKEDLREIVLADNITISWESKPDVAIHQFEIYSYTDSEEIKVLKMFKKQYDVVYAKADFQHYYVRFKTVEDFVKFKNYALELSRPYYVFEADVEKVVRIGRKYHGVVELAPLNSFDVTITLAKILGLRNDY